jgi:hypothetical protein
MRRRGNQPLQKITEAIPGRVEPVVAAFFYSLYRSLLLAALHGQQFGLFLPAENRALKKC